MENNKIVEIKWLILFSIFVIVITSVPYWIGFNLQNELYKFSGFIIGVGDGNSYLAKMMIGASGDWLFTTPYTAYPQMKFFAFFPYILLGKLAGGSEQTLQLIVIFHLFRWAGITFLIFETYKFSKVFIKTKRVSYLITILLVFGGGLGWVGVLFPGLLDSRLPLEFYSPETFGFISVFSLPHLLFGRGFLYRSFRLLLNRESNPQKSNRIILSSGFALALSGIFQPINIFIGWLVVGVYHFVKIIQQKKIWKNVGIYLLWLLPSSPLFFYNFFAFLFDPYLSAWQDQNRIMSPPMIDYLLAYGLGLVFIFIAFRINLFSKVNHTLFINVWISLVPILIYFPINIQRRLVEGVWIAFCIYLGIVIFHLRNWTLKVFAFTVFILSTLLFILGAFQAVRNVASPIYSHASIVDVGNFLLNEINSGDVVLAPFDESNLLPVYAPMKVITGHGPESKNLEEISKQIDSFYRGDFDQEKLKEFLGPFNIKYIVIPKEFNLEIILTQFEPNQIQIIFENENYSILKFFR